MTNIEWLELAKKRIHNFLYPPFGNANKHDLEYSIKIINEVIAELKLKTKMNVLILEDNPQRIKVMKELFKNHILFVFDNIKDAKKIVQEHDVDCFYLDHDLDGETWADSKEENTGYQFVKWLVDNQYCKNSLFYIHSMNVVGANRMLNYLKDNGYDGICYPFHLWKT